MGTTLYRKYRPQVFDNIVGQHHVKVTLLHELVGGRLAHAYLFTGPRGVGKTTIARLLAKSVNCLNPQKDGGPDNTCEACVEIREGHCLDLIEIDAASNTGVDHVREHIIENARFTPSRWKFKIFIIDEVHMLSLSAFNALLKTLEEPPAHALFILATTEIHKVPETIISRCQRFDFRQLRHEDLLERLRFLVKEEDIEVDEAVLDAIARFARGSARDAENLLGQVLTLGESPITLEQAQLVLPRSDFHLVVELFDSLVTNDASAGIKLINRLVNEGVNLSQFTQNAVEFFRKALLLKVNSQLDMFSSLELPKDDEKKILEQVEHVSLYDLQRMIRIFLEHEQRLRMSFIPQLPLEMAVLEVTAGRDVPAGVSIAAPTPPRPRPAAPSAPPPPVESAAPTVPAEKKPAPKPRQGTGKLALSDVQKHWNTVLEHLQKESHSLRLTFNVATLQDVTDGVITVAVGYEFHRERLETPRHREVVERVLSTVLDQPVTLRTIVDEAMSTRSYEKEANVEAVPVATLTPAAPAASAADRPPEGSWDALVDMFGGKAA